MSILELGVILTAEDLILGVWLSLWKHMMCEALTLQNRNFAVVECRDRAVDHDT